MATEKTILDKEIGMKSYFNSDMEGKIISAMKKNANRFKVPAQELLVGFQQWLEKNKQEGKSPEQIAEAYLTQETK